MRISARAEEMSHRLTAHRESPTWLNFGTCPLYTVRPIPPAMKDKSGAVKIYTKCFVRLPKEHMERKPMKNDTGMIAEVKMRSNTVIRQHMNSWTGVEIRTYLRRHNKIKQKHYILIQNLRSTADLPCDYKGSTGEQIDVGRGVPAVNTKTTSEPISLYVTYDRTHE